MTVSRFFCALLAATMLLAGCASKGGTGALGGAGLGALAGAVIGGDTEAALIGGAVGTGVGYIVGNEMDKKHAKTLEKPGTPVDATHTETGPFAGTRWKVVALAPEGVYGEYLSKIVEFQADGTIITTTTLEGGDVKQRKERYRVAEGKLILNDDGYLINCDYTLTGDRLTATADKFTAILEKLP